MSSFSVDIIAAADIALSFADNASSRINPAAACSLRIVLINDVYELDNFPQFQVARSQANDSPVGSTGQSKPNNCIGVIAGDFLAPSMLSSVDKGVGMVDCLNRAGIDYCYRIFISISYIFIIFV